MKENCTLSARHLFKLLAEFYHVVIKKKFKKKNFYPILISTPVFKGVMKAQDWMPWQRQSVSLKKKYVRIHCLKLNNILLIKTATWLEKWNKNAGGRKQ